MKPGDVLRLKEGTLGRSEARELYAIYLDRVKRGSDYLVVAHTVDGEQELSREKVQDVALKARVDDPASMSGNQLDDRLAQLAREIEADGGPDAEVERRASIDELDDRRAWELVVNEVEGSLTPEDAAHLIFEDPDADDVGQVRDALQSCQREGVGYFERAEGRGERYQAYTVDEIKAVRREIEGLRKLRNELITVEEVEDPDEDEPDKRIVSVHPDDAGLDEADRERLELVGDQMVDFVLHDRDRGRVGLAGTPIHTLDSFILNRFCRFLAYDWLGTQDTTISGAYVRFLLETNLLDTRKANTLVARRHVNLSEHFAWTYPERPERQANRMELGLDDGERERREDFTHLETLTIDPEDAGDFDDAISLEADDDAARLYVHIADVSHYVDRGSALDFEARSRGTSAYLPTGVLPMLPPRLSEQLCSLRAGEPRTAVTVVLTIEEGQVRDAEVLESIVEVDANRSYEHADQAIEEGTEPYASLHELAQAMRAERTGLELETDEVTVHVGREGIDPSRKTGTRATRLIEQFMVAANEAVARRLTEADVPAPYRCHPLPERSSVDEFNRQMEVMEQPIRLELPELDDEDEADEGDQDAEELMEALEGGGSIELVEGGFVGAEADEPDDEEEADDDEPAGGAAALPGLADLDEDEREAWLAPFHEALEAVQGVDDDRVRDLVHLKLLGCMGRAFYTPDNLGHFGLGSTCYVHFTSPIRRYPDLVVHRQLKALLRGEDEPPHDREELVDLCPRNSEQGQEAEQLERDLIAVAMAFDTLDDEEARGGVGVVNGITKGGVFLTLERGREARLPTSEIPGGPWDVDEAGAKLYRGEIESPTELSEEAAEADWREMEDPETGELVHVRLRLGDRVPVQASSIDLAEGQIAVKLAGGPDEGDAEAA